MIIRPATPADVPRLIDILNQIIEIGGTTAYQDPLDAGYLDRFFTGNSKTFLHVAENVDGIQGMQWMDALDPPNDHIGGIATFADPTTTQRGVGTALFDITKAASLAAGYSELYAKIRADNTGGLAYYEKMGFRDHLVDRAVPLKDGTPVDRITKRLKLDPSH
ncbi:GNAT family N-acetyltransferase [uncultured Litoreibacter sp.]|uniref:GNAT family N-acetyltransferase n=1 Tax=uncultured Litoreibacter sp. TaxID=1392394 RepID=UPI002607D83C|nr:GNAT family N-acetyltransferase [uncultured Litoreibacter sp.]